MIDQSDAKSVQPSWSPERVLIDLCIREEVDGRGGCHTKNSNFDLVPERFEGARGGEEALCHGVRRMETEHFGELISEEAEHRTSIDARSEMYAISARSQQKRDSVVFTDLGRKGHQT
jgi:hypothetical protein